MLTSFNTDIGQSLEKRENEGAVASPICLMGSLALAHPRRLIMRGGLGIVNRPPA